MWEVCCWAARCVCVSVDHANGRMAVCRSAMGAMKAALAAFRQPARPPPGSNAVAAAVAAGSATARGRMSRVVGGMGATVAAGGRIAGGKASCMAANNDYFHSASTPLDHQQTANAAPRLLPASRYCAPAARSPSPTLWLLAPLLIDSSRHCAHPPVPPKLSAATVGPALQHRSPSWKACSSQAFPTAPIKQPRALPAGL